MKYLETKLPDNFCQPIFNECIESIAASTSFNLIGLPSVGMSYFIRFLAAKSERKFIHINTYELSDFTKEMFFKQFAEKTNKQLTSDNYLQEARKGLENLAKEII